MWNCSLWSDWFYDMSRSSKHLQAPQSFQRTEMSGSMSRNVNVDTMSLWINTTLNWFETCRQRFSLSKVTQQITHYTRLKALALHRISYTCQYIYWVFKNVVRLRPPGTLPTVVTYRPRNSCDITNQTIPLFLCTLKRSGSLGTRLYTMYHTDHIIVWLYHCTFTYVSTPKKLRVLGKIELLQFLLTEFVCLSIQVLLDLQCVIYNSVHKTVDLLFCLTFSLECRRCHITDIQPTC